MHNITYISDADRARLVELNEAVRACTTVEEQRAIREEIVELEGKRKPLHECTLQEVTELRTFVWDKFQKLNGTGKYHLAQQFKAMLMQIEKRSNIIQAEMTAKEKARAVEKQTAKATPQKKASDDTSKGKPQRRQTTSRWTTGIGDLD